MAFENVLLRIKGFLDPRGLQPPRGSSAGQGRGRGRGHSRGGGTVVGDNCHSPSNYYIMLKKEMTKFIDIIFNDPTASQDLQGKNVGNNGFCPGTRLMGVMMYQLVLLLTCQTFSTSFVKYF